MKYETKSDKYTKARGGTSKFLILSCSNCDNDIILYQKDGVGTLVRLYLDKIVAPENLCNELKLIKTKKDMHGLRCPVCNELLAVPMIYEKENRLAFKLLKNKLHKKEELSPLEWNI